MIEIIPAIDLIDGKCVRLLKGDFDKKRVYSDDPLETAIWFEAAGLKRLHIVDLDGAKTGKIVNLDVLAKIAAGTELKIDFGGGIKSDADVARVFDAGAAIVNVGSAAVKEPEQFFAWLDQYGSDRVLLGGDAKDGKLAINGWQQETQIDVLAFLKQYFERGVTQAFVTDIGKDGALEGPGCDLYREIRAAVPELQLIASGGVRSVEDIRELERIGCSGVIIGKAIYEGRIKPEELGNYKC
jgi:phosphoribosylformimino-5-aminoimidazole carboxamide ribotide isomerase